MRRSETHSEQRKGMTGRRILAVPLREDTDSNQSHTSVEAGRYCAMAAEWGFDVLSVPTERFSSGSEQLQEWHRACAEAGLLLMLDAPAESLAERDNPLINALLAHRSADAPGGALLLRHMGRLNAAASRQLVERLAEHHGILVTVWTPGMTLEQVAALGSMPIDGVYSSLPWWNFKDTWLTEEYERLSRVAPVIAPLRDIRAPMNGASKTESGLRRLAVGTMAGDAVLVPAECLPGMDPDTRARELLRLNLHESGGVLRRITGALSNVTGLLREGEEHRLLLLNPDANESVTVDRHLIERRLPDGMVLRAEDSSMLALEPAGWNFLTLARTPPVASLGTSSSQTRRSLAAAMRSPRIAIEDVRPAVDGGVFAVKRTLGESVVIGANIFMDGHEELAAEVLWRSADETDWHHEPMILRGNDAWEARIAPRRLGTHVFVIRAWLDRWETFRVQLEKKFAAGNDVRVEVEEARHVLVAHLGRARGERAHAAAALEAALQVVGPPLVEPPTARRRRTKAASDGNGNNDAPTLPPASAEQVRALLADDLAQAIHIVDERAFEVETPVHYPLCIERSEATFASWYELFPRSQSPVEGRHGTLRDVIARLPMIQSMGFDVLYFPPIHPIGTRNRKGRNNSLTAEPGDPGSPYAIGAPEGGHDALHPELGTLDDFRELIEAAKHHGLEIAMDFAIQCSPDHPWLKEHPDWFNWRIDGSLKYAENPPKRYEDIVNPDFYSPLASTPRQAALWRALRDVVLFWAGQGVKIFRVDNPHTKPLPFWQWMLREVRERHPDVIFLSEAFTRPAMMYRLAKIGFSQSYTYFTWRNTRRELTSYLEELNREPVRDFFRPNFFVNTPDINPWFLQTSGRPGFLIRAVLAGTLAGSWGMYNGFELCVADPVPGKEEYLDSEKYQLRRWDMDAPGNIIQEISWLNRMRRAHPALQSHLGIRFHAVDNEQMIFYSRHSPEGDSIVLVVVSLDPHHRQSGTLDLPRWEWGMDGDAPLHLHDLYEDTHFTLHGRSHRLALSPERPFALWAITSPHREAA